MNKRVIIDKKICIGCGACVENCPVNILYIFDDKCNVTDETKCDKGKGCEIVCPTGAIRIHT
jgi:NAD-dependent dihydropyrimidine dehydrogenase PreA subunit